MADTKEVTVETIQEAVKKVGNMYSPPPNPLRPFIFGELITEKDEEPKGE